MRQQRLAAGAVLGFGVACTLAGCGFGGGSGGSVGVSAATGSGGTNTNTGGSNTGTSGNNTGGNTGGTTTPASTITYQHDVAQILKANCTSCHTAGGSEPASPLDSYPAVTTGKTTLGFTPAAFVVAGNPSASLLVAKIQGASNCGAPMPQTGSLSAADIQTIVTWIQQGALDTAPGTPSGPSAPAQLVIVAGNGQSGIAGNAVSALIVEVTDASSTPVPGVTVDFAITNGSGSLSAASAVTAANGQASTVLTLPASAGNVTVTASATGLNPISFAETATSALQKRSYVADIAPILALHCTACHGPGGSESGTPLDSYTHVTTGTTTHGYTPAAFVVAGDPTNSLLYLKVTGPSKTQGGLMPPNAPLSPSEIAVIDAWIQQGAVDSLSGPPSSLTIASGNGQSGPAGSRLPKQLQIELQDSNASPVAGVLVTFSLVGTNGSISPTTALTDGSGHASTTLILGMGTGTVSVQATAAGLGPVQFDETSLVSTYSGAPLAGSTNAFDVAALQGLREANVEPAPLSSDTEFLRRVTADVVGRLPSSSELAAFLADTSATKRATVIDNLLASPEYANHWANDVLAPWACVSTNATNFNPALVTDVQNDMPISQLVTMFITGAGVEGLSYTTQFPGNGGNDLVDQAMLSFTGMTSQCARCHDHHLTVAGQDDPMWVQDDNYGLYAFLATSNGAATKLNSAGKRFGSPVEPHWVVDGYAKEIPVGDPSLPLLTDPLSTRAAKFASLLTTSQAFYRGFGHRIFSELLDPLLDPNQFLGANLLAVQQPAVLDACRTEFAAQGTSLKNYLREILNSNLYQLTTAGTTTANDRILARRTVRRHHSEVVDHGVSQSAGVTFTAQNGFMQTTFGYPRLRATIIDRSDAVNLGQPLVLLNSTQATNGRMTATGNQITALANQVTAKTITLGQAITTIYESALGRDPSPSELTAVQNAVAASPTPLQALQDVLVGICSSVEFVSR